MRPPALSTARGGRQESYLLEEGRRVRHALHGIGFRQLLELVDVLHEDLPLARRAEVELVLLGPLAQQRVERLGS